MLSKNVVFVIGAGASEPYGHPLGSDLRRHLCIPDYSNVGFPILPTLIKVGGIDPARLEEFSQIFLHSGQLSIDAFLSKRSEEFSEIGTHRSGLAFLRLASQAQPERGSALAQLGDRLAGRAARGQPSRWRAGRAQSSYRPAGRAQSSTRNRAAQSDCDGSGKVARESYAADLRAWRIPTIWQRSRQPRSTSISKGGTLWTAFRSPAELS